MLGCTTIPVQGGGARSRVRDKPWLSTSRDPESPLDALIALLQTTRSFASEGCTYPTELPPPTKAAAERAAHVLGALLLRRLTEAKTERLTLRGLRDLVRGLDLLVAGLGPAATKDPAAVLLLDAFRQAVAHRMRSHDNGDIVAEAVNMLPSAETAAAAVKAAREARPVAREAAPAPPRPVIAGAEIPARPRQPEKPPVAPDIPPADLVPVDAFTFSAVQNGPDGEVLVLTPDMLAKSHNSPEERAQAEAEKVAEAVQKRIADEDKATVAGLSGIERLIVKTTDKIAGKRVPAATGAFPA
jgi:hypothetical protein